MDGIFSFKDALSGKVKDDVPPPAREVIPVEAQVIGPVEAPSTLPAQAGSGFQFTSQMDQGAVYQDRRMVKIQRHGDGSWSAIAVFESHGEGELPAMLQLTQSSPKFVNSMFDLLFSIPGSLGGFKGLGRCVIPSLPRIVRNDPDAGS